MLLALILIPALTALAIVASPPRRAAALAIAGSTLAFALALAVTVGFDFDQAGRWQHQAAWSWMPELGLRLSLGVDSISLLLILLTVFLMPLTVWASTTAVADRPKQFFAWLMALEAAMVGVFAARDLIVFYTCFEFTLLPMYFLIANYGSANRARASIVFFLYTFAGSIITLAGLVYVAFVHHETAGQWSFDVDDLVRAATSMSPTAQGWVLLALLCGFAVKVPLFPVHTWLPLAHTEAPTAGSVMLAAVLLKLGTYGLYRFALPMAPDAIHAFAPVIAVLCLIGILYGALVCWVQRDMKRLIAYSSVSHLGFCVLGLAALNVTGLSGSVFYMINHGLSTGALFLCIGMIYERYHTRAMADFSGLARIMPVWAFFMVFFTMSSVALPGLNGFVSEFLCLAGTFWSGQEIAGIAHPGPLGPWYAAVAGLGMILAAIYLLYLLGRIVWGPLHYPQEEHDHHPHGPRLPRDLTAREILVLTPIAIVCLALGVRPGLILDPIDQPIREVLANVHDSSTDRAWLAEAPAADSTPIVAEVSRD